MEVIHKQKPVEFAKFVQVQEDGSEFVCDLPISNNFNDGTGILFYKNKGFIPFDVYEAQKHSKEVAAKQDAKKSK